MTGAAASHAPTVEFQILASPNPRFARMLYFLIHSIAARANLAGRWKATVTFGRDGPLLPSSPELSWAKDFPVTFRYTPVDLWEHHAEQARRSGQASQIYNANSLYLHDQSFQSTIVIFMDADMVVLGSLAEVVQQCHHDHELLAWPAWNPPPADLRTILAHCGIDPGHRQTQHSGYGWSFLEPRNGLPYFNYGFVVCPGHTANLIAVSLPGLFAQVSEHCPILLGWQMALSAAVIKHSIPYTELPERYNYGNGGDMKPLLKGAEAVELLERQRTEAANIRVLHYCVDTPNFRKAKTMTDNGRLRAFSQLGGLKGGEALLQQALLAYLPGWDKIVASAAAEPVIEKP